jgi:hypothetical protein
MTPQYNEEAFRLLDKVIMTSAKYGIYVIVPLTTFWPGVLCPYVLSNRCVFTRKFCPEVTEVFEAVIPLMMPATLLHWSHKKGLKWVVSC